MFMNLVYLSALHENHLLILLNMAMLATNFLLISALINNTFYVSRPYNAQEVYICFNKTNETWPSAWLRMKLERDPASFSIMLPENTTEYNLRIIFMNRTFGDSGWKNLSTCVKNASLTKISQQKETTCSPHLVPVLIYYISLVISFLFIKTIIHLVVEIHTHYRH